MFKLMAILLTLNSAFADDVCQKNKAVLESKATQSFLTSIKTAAITEINLHYRKNNLGPVKFIDLVGHSPEVLNFKVEAGKDSVQLMVKIKDKIKVAIWPEDKKEVDALGRAKTPGTKCIANAYTYATTKDKLFLDIQNAQTKAVITSFSVKNLVVEEMNFK